MNAFSLPVGAGTNSLPSARAQIVERRTYLRPLNEEGTQFETSDDMLRRVLRHQQWLWERQVGRELNDEEQAELEELWDLMKARKLSMSGRVKWMGGTDLVKARSSAAFNCSFTTVNTPADLVDVFWLLLQGCGVGFKPLPGLLTGFNSSVKEIRVIGSARQDKGGQEDNTEEWIPETGEWIITVGDSAKAWAKALGKIMAGKYPAKSLTIDLSELRPGGKRLKGYGWLSSGWEPLAKALKRIGKIMMKASDRILTALEIGDIVNFLGTVLSSRRSAQIWMLDDTSPEIEGFIDFKVGRYENGNQQREQSNNSILFWSKPSRERIVDLLTRILGGGDPGFINAAEARRRAPDFQGGNPCAEILLPSKGFCNLVQVVWHRFNGDFKGLLRAQYIAGRANYRQTCVSMKDGVLQLGWNDNQHLLRLCGVAPLGYVAWEGMNQTHMLEVVRDAAINGANSMADELGTPRPRRVTQVQPGGTSSKHLGLEGDEVQEGAHLSLSRWIFNNMNVSKGEPLVDALRQANYAISDHPFDPTAVLVKIPVEYPASPLFTKTTMVIDGREEAVEVNQESAVSQLERYRILMKHYVQHNCFTGATKFLTAEKGMASFAEFNDGDEIQVMNRHGKWTPATVKSFGDQKIWRVTLDRAGTQHVIETTAEHRWPLQNANDRYRGREVWTTTDQLANFTDRNFTTVLPDLEIGLDEEYVLRGIVFGDGTLYNHPRTKSKVVLCECGTPTKSCSKTDLVPLFEKAGFTVSKPDSRGNQTVHGLPAEWKHSLPQINNSTPEQLRGFIAGWFATDGSVSGTSVTISAANASDLEWLQQAAAKAGISVMTEIKEQLRRGFGDVEKPIYRIVIAKASLSPDFFLLDWKKLDDEFDIKHWSIVSVEETDRIESVFCVVEPSAHEFVLEGNILTGNCSITISFDESEIEAMADWFMANWDDYVGVSFLQRNDPTKTAEDLGFSYLPQQAVSERMYDEYVRQLLPIDLSGDTSQELIEDLVGCQTGACPIR